MKHLKSLTINSLIVAMLLFLFSACQEDSSITEPTGGSDYDQIQKVISDDEVIQSFEPNYNEEEAMDLLTGGLAKTIYPVRVGQKMVLVNKNIDIDIQGDSAYAFITNTFKGILFIAASYDEFSTVDSNTVDTLIQKEFTATTTRNVVLVKRDNKINPLQNWKIVKVSLPEGGVITDNIQITKMSIYLPNGNEIVVDSPNDYYLTRDPGLRHQLPIIGRGEEVTIRMEVRSKYADDDFVTLTWGAFRSGRYHRSKKLFELVSSEFDGQYYNKVYENTWRANYYPGFKHAIINAMPKQVIYDDETPVETSTWGIPYLVL
ncbi:MAG: hypothetical protein GXO85_14400 [Chlorobi bacterium]|nr:hypothetical protein [Chlorobiota bacterium]